MVIDPHEEATGTAGEGWKYISTCIAVIVGAIKPEGICACAIREIGA
jgi:hypothetical protein